MPKVKLLAVIDHLGGGGAERQFIELTRRIDRERFEVKIFLTEGGGVRLKEALGYGLDINCPSEEIRRDTPRALLRLISSIKKTSPDIIMAWLSYSATLTAFAAAATGKKRLIFSERSSLERLFNVEVKFGAVKKFILKSAFRRARFVVTNSREVAAEFDLLGYSDGSRTRVIYNGVDLEKFSALPPKEVLRERLGLRKGGVIGVFVGKLEYRKGVSFIIKALEDTGVPGFEFLAIGSGSMEKEVKGSDKINYLGYTGNAIEYIKASDFLVLPSLYEGLPNVVLEAMAVGTPVIATRVSGIPEIIENEKTGLLIPPEDPEALKGAMARLAGDRALRDSLSLNAMERIKGFAMEKMVASFEGLILEAMKS